jgi:hemerythrin-like metal-binding protein
MEYVKWKENYSVANGFIDNQHKELFKLINVFYNSIKDNNGKAAIMKAITDMENYTVIHFKKEEEMLLKAGYPYLQIHKLEHQKFIDTVADFRKRYEEGRLILSLEVTAFVKNWITNHIMKTDQQYNGKI